MSYYRYTHTNPESGETIARELPITTQQAGQHATQVRSEDERMEQMATAHLGAPKDPDTDIDL